MENHPRSFVRLSGLAAALCLLLLVASPARTQETPGQLGLGAYIGTPFGFTGKYLFNSQYAVASALGVQGDNFDMHIDGLVHLRDLVPQPRQGKLPVYLGLGIKIKDEANTLFGFRFVGGMSYLVEKYPLELFAEIAPVLRVAPSAGSNLDGGVGIRYYFKLK